MSRHAGTPHRPIHPGSPTARVARTLPLVIITALVAGACVHREEVVTSRQVIGAGTTGGDAVVRSGRNLPAQFEVVVAPSVSSDCPPQLRDAAMQTVLTLENSTLQPVRDSLGTHYRAVGDYSVNPRGRYGDEQPGDGLRIDCARRRAIGVVRLETSGRP